MTTATSPLSTLRDEQALLASLLTLLKQEQQCLVSADTEGLSALTPQKSQLLVQVGQLASQRHRALGAAGFAAGESGMDAWLAASGDRTAPSLWQELLGLTRAAKELNRVNGMLINKQMSYNQTVLNALRSPAPGDGGCYGPSGQTTGAAPSRRYVVG